MTEVKTTERVFDEIELAMPDGLSVAELSVIIKVGQRNIRRRIRRLRDEERVVIGRWERATGTKTGGDFIPFYVVKTSPGQADAKKPPKLTRGEKLQSYRRRNRAVLYLKRLQKSKGSVDPFAQLRLAATTASGSALSRPVKTPRTARGAGKGSAKKSADSDTIG